MRNNLHPASFVLCVAIALFINAEASFGIRYVHLQTQIVSDGIPRVAVEVDGNVYPEPQFDQLFPCGWRIIPDADPAAPDGYVLLSWVWVQDSQDERRAIAEITTRTQAEQDAIDAAEAAAQQAAQEEWENGIEVFPRKIEAPVVIIKSESAGKGIGCDWTTHWRVTWHTKCTTSAPGTRSARFTQRSRSFGQRWTSSLPLRPLCASTGARRSSLCTRS